METVWILHLLVCISLNILAPSAGNPLDESEETDLKYSDEYFPDTNTFLANIPDKRLSKFVRIGRGLSSFIRIGRAQPELYGYENDDEESFDDDDRSAFAFPEKRRLSSFVRIGRGGDNVDFSQPLSDDFQKRNGAFIRMGKFPSSAMLRHRNGIIHSIARQPYYRRSGRIGQSSFIRIGKRDTSDALQRMENEHEDNTAEEYRRYLRIGKRNDGDTSDQGEDVFNNLDKKRLSSFVRIGKGQTILPDDLYRKYVELKNLKAKRMSKFVRIGKDGLDADKRMSKFVRIGKGDQMSYGPAMDKKMSKFVRIGKGDQMSYGPAMDKKMSKFVRIGKGDLMEYGPTMDKKMSKFVRIGKGDTMGYGPAMDKKMSKFVRIGKGDTMGYAPAMDKKMSKFVRIGKGDTMEYGPAMDKKMSKFVRIGKDIDNLQSDIDKRLSSFVRIGKSETYEDTPDKRLSSFVRIGKNVDGPEEKADTFLNYDEDDSDNDLAIDNKEGLIDGINSLENISSGSEIGSLSKELDKRALSKFVRIGKSTNDMNTETADKRGRLSSFVRIGRSAEQAEEVAPMIQEAN